MNLTPITTGLRTIIAGIVHNSPIILTGLGVAGLVGTTVMAVQATPKAIQAINRADADKERDLTNKEKALVVWKYYIPTAAMGLLTVTCIVGANRISLRRNAALASVYSLTETALREYQSKVVETIGTTKEQKIRDDISQDRLNAHPISNQQVIITGGGDMLCFDSLSGRYFKSDVDKIRKIENKLNREILSWSFVSANQLYFELGLEGIPLGDDVGWNTDFPLTFDFSSKLTEDDRPCLLLNYRIGPKEGYKTLY